MILIENLQINTIFIALPQVINIYNHSPSLNARGARMYRCVAYSCVFRAREQKMFAQIDPGDITKKFWIIIPEKKSISYTNYSRSSVIHTIKFEYKLYLKISVLSFVFWNPR